MTVCGGGSRPWRNAASMIIVAKNSSPKNTLFNYECLMLRRSGKSKFMPNAYVFPGGVIASPQDFDPSWKGVIKKHAGGNRTEQEIIGR